MHTVGFIETILDNEMGQERKPRIPVYRIQIIRESGTVALKSDPRKVSMETSRCFWLENSLWEMLATASFLLVDELCI
jgi:hypothetical protein